MRKCRDCKKSENEVPFYNGSNRCTDCQKEFMTIYRLKSRIEAIIAYGGKKPKCACPGCDESRLMFLTIDHIHGGGNAHRAELSNQTNKRDGKMSPGGGVFFRWLKKNSYPTGYQVLCYNCNNARGTGQCPVHESSMPKNRRNALAKLLKPRT